MLLPKTHSPADCDKIVAESCDHYNRSGEIRDILLTGFDQNGCWIGLTSLIDGSELPSRLTAKLQHEEIPISRLLTETTSGESTLWSSYHSSIESEICFPYHHVAGSLHAHEARAFSAPHLRSVGGDIELWAATRLGIPNLARVGGKFVAGAVASFIADRLQFIGGGLYTYLAKQIHAPLLRIVGGPLQVGSATQLDLSSLCGVMSEMDCDAAEELNLPELRQVNGELLADSAGTLIAPELYRVGFLTANSATCVRVPKLSIDACSISLPKARDFIEVDEAGRRTLHASIIDCGSDDVVVDFTHVKGDIFVLAESFHAPNLESVEGDFEAWSAQEFVAPRLRRVGGNLDTSSALEFRKADLHCGSWSWHPDAM